MDSQRLRRYDPRVHPTSSRSCWPSAAQELLLRAALHEGAAAAQAWKSWNAAVALDDIDVGSMRILPLVACNAAHVDLARSADGGRLRGVHRRSWYQNQMLIQAVRPALEALEREGLQPLLLKGAALSATVYGDLGARPMADVDVLVRPSRALDAAGVLVAHGFAPLFRIDASRVRTLNAVGFASRAASLDLHWHLLPEPCDSAFDDEVHTRARPARLRDLDVRVLDPTDELLLACAHGVRWNPIPPLRWVADAHLLITRADVSWPLLSASARRHRLVLPVLGALRYLADRIGTPVPATVLEELEAARPTFLERFEYLLRISPTADLLMGNLPAYWARHVRRTSGASTVTRLGSFPAYLADCWGCDSVAQARELALARVRSRLRMAPGLLSGRLAHPHATTDDARDSLRGPARGDTYDDASRH